MLPAIALMSVQMFPAFSSVAPSVVHHQHEQAQSKRQVCTLHRRIVGWAVNILHLPGRYISCVIEAWVVVRY